MYLKRLDVIGFKSFADRIGIDFVPGVTAVVGPNGSGKSNVTDAIRWVLGEQSAKSLRGAKMEDVIFAGSESRKPLNFAEVTLILDNTDGRLPLDYSEVSVTRRVFRSGESAYLLNKQNCRLKDITDLFIDSGLGKEAFSIISQGRVDEILNSKAEDRRSIFEEAAGVLKYKQRKKKAELKLNETEDNLSRVLDILHELDGRMEPLQIQASKARDYLEMTEELKDADIALLAFDIAQQEEELAVFRKETEELAVIQQELIQEIDGDEAAVGLIRKALFTIDDVIDKSQQALVEASAESEKWEGRKLLLSERKQNTERQAEQLQDRITAELAENEKLKSGLISQTELLKELKEQQQTAIKEIRQLDDRLHLTPDDLEKEIDSFKAVYIDLMNEQATIKNELKNIELQERQLEESSGRVSQQVRSFKEELDDLQKQKNAAELQLAEISSRLSAKRKQYQEKESAFHLLKAEVDKKQSLLLQAYQNERQLSARIETLQELEADFSGFFQGVREVLLARESGKLPGVAGAVAEMIQVEAPYAKAMETAFGAASQHIITETEEHARQAISFLRSKRAGRATFLPMSVMKPRKIPETVIETVREHPAFVNVAYELVSHKPAYRQVIENLIGNVLVAADLKGASEIARLTMNRYRVVTLEGDVVNAGGSMTGGAVKSQTSLFSRKAELDRLLTQQAALKETIQAAEKTVASEKGETEAMEEQLNRLRSEGEHLRNDEAAHTVALREVEAVLKRTEERYSLFQLEQQNRSSGLEEVGNRRTSAADRLKEVSAELSETSAEIERLSAFKQQSESDREKILELLAARKSDLAVMKERTAQAAVNERNFSERKQKSDKLLKAYQEELAWLKSEKSSVSFTNEEVAAEIQKWTVKKEAEQQNVQEAKAERAHHQQQLDELSEKLKEKQRILKGYTEAVRIAEVKSTRTEVQIQTLLKQLEENYRLPLEEARSFSLPDAEPAVRKKVKLLKQSIEELGPVNVAAIAEFDQVAERHTFLTEQRNDLNEAKETLRTVIQEMDEEMTVRFDDTFHAIRIQFQRVFKELFGGGSADLRLTNPNDILGTGVDIVAQPPGKKLQNLSLLSGGERALTAIALLFAILNIRPVPFCILDEVEAALDEANVTRYSRYLKKFSEQTQFIVITHRKGTMEGADVLYGITMQESGISKLVSVKMQEEI